ncbi:MAG TPA: low temperature requirement protein A, partial [Candidatus Limnocylindria bacterium]|nr:low temperature requirement protein A [Candidatus Limnocylindria bacterium]
QWWLYFKRSAAVDRQQPVRVAIAWSYGHFVIFAAVAALGAGLQVAIDAIQGDAHLAPEVAALTVAVPVVVYLIAVAILHARPFHWRSLTPVAIAGALLLIVAAGAPWTGVPLAVLIMGFVVSGLIALMLIAQGRLRAR